MSVYDVIIVGSGIAGATAALALARETELQIALVDAKVIPDNWTSDCYSQRVSAISLASERIFRHLNVWDAMVSKRVSPYQKMQVWDAEGNGKIDFDCATLQTAALGYIIEDDVIRQALLTEVQLQKNIQYIAPLKLLSLQKKSQHVELLTEQQGLMQAALIIGADGAHSWVRQAAGIALNNKNYQHTAIVATVKTTLKHAATARQRFLTSGPLAFLPLADEYSNSIVWSTAPSHAAELMTLDDEEFQQRLAAAFDYVLGDIVETGPRSSFPLEMRHAKNYVQPGIALIGDAAHTIHPLAGQGINLGLLDAVSLAEVVATAADRQHDFASLATLRRYERWRKGDNAAMLTFVAAIKKLFGTRANSLQCLRSSGLNLTNQLDFVKNFFADYAAGNRGDLPVLAQE